MPMIERTLVDTSSWIESLRENGRPEVKARVDRLIRSGNAAWCSAIRLELWNHRSGPEERRKLERLAAVIDDLPIDERVWEASAVLAVRARASGLTVPAMDLLIAACAANYGLPVEATDTHFAALRQLP